MTDFERRISFPRAAFEKRHDDPRRDYGIGCVMGHFTLIGPDGALTWELFTGFYLPHVRERLRRESRHEPYGHGLEGWMRCSLEGHGGALDIHSPKPLYEDHEPSTNCTLMPGGKCYSDVGFSIGDTLFDALCEGGDEGLWRAMEGIYADQFDVVASPATTEREASDG